MTTTSESLTGNLITVLRNIIIMMKKQEGDFCYLFQIKINTLIHSEESNPHIFHLGSR